LNAALDKYAPLVNMADERAISRQSRPICAFIKRTRIWPSWCAAQKIDEARELLMKQARRSTAPVRQPGQGGGHQHRRQREDRPGGPAALRELAPDDLVLLAACIGLGLLATWVARIVSRPLQDAMHVAERVADGDLTVHIHPAGATKPAA
jgi:methyl-accepting chemotaxis protein